MRELDTVRARSDNRGLCMIVRDNDLGLPIDHLEEMVTPAGPPKRLRPPVAVAWAWRWSAHAVTRMGAAPSAQPTTAAPSSTSTYRADRFTLNLIFGVTSRRSLIGSP
jgi:hypothetical protein